jgi:group I intron endonuclease
MFKCGIYKITNLTNSKVYIGQSVNLNSRKSAYRNGNFHNAHIRNAVNKYGWENFSIQILLYCDEEWLDHYEISLIKLYKSIDGIFGYNKESGGNKNKRLSEDVKKRMSEKKKGTLLGKENPFYGKKHTEETKEKISRSRKGKLVGEYNPNYGKETPEETKKKIGDANRGRVVSQEHRGKLSDAMMGKHSGSNNPFHGRKHSDELVKKRSKPIIGTNIDNGDEIYFYSCSEAERCGFKNCRSVLNGKHKQCKGFIFRYV